MANVLFTLTCNRQCAYCFARDKLDLGADGGPARVLSPEGLERVIGFARRSALRRFVILGGEPTLHPDFAALLGRVLREPSFRWVVVFSNGLMPGPALDCLAACGDPRLRVVINLHAPEEDTAEERGRIGEALQRLGGRAGIGVTLRRPDQGLDFVADAVRAARGVREVRLGLAHPIPGEGNEFARQDDLPGIAARIVDLAGKARAGGFTFSFDCGFPFCMFTLDQHRELLRCGVKFASRCAPVIDIGPDLGLWRCFPLVNEAPRRLEDFETVQQAADFYDALHRSYLPMGNRPECPQCRYRAAGLCRGGCLARTLASFHRAG